MDSREFAKTLHAIKCNSIASQFSEKTNTEIVKAEMEIDNLILIKNQNKIYSHSIASNVAPDRVHKLEGVRMNEEAFMKAIQTEKLEVYSPESINKFNADISKAFDLGRAKQEDIEKAKKDIGKLTKVQVTRKDGVVTTVYVKRGGDEQSQGKSKPSTEGKKTESSTPEKLKTWDDKTLRKYRDDIKSRISDIQDQLRRDQEDGTRTKESSKKAADEIAKHEKNLKLVRSEIETRKSSNESGDIKVGQLYKWKSGAHMYHYRVTKLEGNKVEVDVLTTGGKTFKHKFGIKSFLNDVVNSKNGKLVSNEEKSNESSSEKDTNKKEHSKKEDVESIQISSSEIEEKGQTKDNLGNVWKKSKSDEVVGYTSVTMPHGKDLGVGENHRNFIKKTLKKKLNTDVELPDKLRNGGTTDFDFLIGKTKYRMYTSGESVKSITYVIQLYKGKKIEKAESNLPSSKEESSEHTKTYKELKEDAKDSKLDTTKKEFGKKIRRDHEAEEKEKGGSKSIKKADTTPEQEKKIAKVMKEFKAGDLKSSSGEVVTDHKQAVAIAMSEAGLSNKK